MTLVAIDNRTRMAAYLTRNPELHLYELGDLDDFFFSRTRWFGWAPRDLEALCLMYTGSFGATLLAFSEPATEPPMASLLAALSEVLPERFYAHLSPGLAPSLLPRFELGPRRPALKMALRDPGALAVDGAGCVGWIKAEDLESVQAFYRVAYPGNWFDARMLDTGCYCGIRERGQWLAIAGVHVFSREYRVASLGNIVTAQDVRQRGNGTQVTSAVCRKLLAEGVEIIGLNVMRGNAPAIAFYRKLGFEVVAEYEELEVRAP